MAKPNETMDAYREQLATALRATMAHGSPVYVRTVPDPYAAEFQPTISAPSSFAQLAPTFLEYFEHYRAIDLVIASNGQAIEDLYYLAAEASMVASAGEPDADLPLLESLVSATEKIISDSILNNFTQGLERSIRDRTPEPPEEVLMDAPDPVEEPAA